MGWTAAKFRKRVFLRYGIELLGWPPHIPFKNPGKATMAHIRELSSLLASGGLCFVHAGLGPNQRAEDISLERACPAVLFDMPLPDYGRRNIGRRVSRQFDCCGNLRPRRYERDGPKSRKVVDAEYTGVVDAEEHWQVTGQGLPQMFKDGAHLVYENGTWRPMAAA